VVLGGLARRVQGLDAIDPEVAPVAGVETPGEQLPRAPERDGPMGINVTFSSTPVTTLTSVPSAKWKRPTMSICHSSIARERSQRL
jgi:hypothetical protein